MHLLAIRFFLGLKQKHAALFTCISYFLCIICTETQNAMQNSRVFYCHKNPEISPTTGCDESQELGFLHAVKCYREILFYYSL